MGKINVKIAPGGQVSVDAEGYSGASCKDATAAIESVLSGGEAEVNVSEKPEMYETGEEEIQTEQW